MDTITDWLPRLLQVSDTAFPTGAFANSFGLEGMVELGIVNNAQTLEDFIVHDLASSLGYLDLPLLRLAHAAIPNEAELMALDELCDSHRSTSELRSFSSRIGKRRLVLLQDLFGGLDQYISILPHGHLPIASAIEAKLLGIPLDAALTTYAYQAFNSAGTSSMKMLRIGQTSIQRIIARSHLLIPKLKDISLSVELEELGLTNPVLDLASSRHERAETRLFLS